MHYCCLIKTRNHRPATKHCFGDLHLGSGLIDHIQKLTVAAMQIADMKVCEHQSKRLTMPPTFIHSEVRSGGLICPEGGGSGGDGAELVGLRSAVPRRGNVLANSGGVRQPSGELGRALL